MDARLCRAPCAAPQHGQGQICRQRCHPVTTHHRSTAPVTQPHQQLASRLAPLSAQSNSEANPPAEGSKASTSQPQSLLQRIKGFFQGNKLDKQKLAALGFGAFAAYGVISNINAGILVTIAWLTIVKTHGVTPLAAGMWPKFLAVYAGLWVSSHFLRPFRLSLAIAAAPFVDNLLNAIASKTRLPKVGAFGIILACIAVGSVAVLGAMLAVCGGFPDGLPFALPGTAKALA